MRLGSLFSGCGGLDLGLHYAGLELAWACETDKHARSVLERHWPGVPIAEDVREVDAGFAPIDVLAGGFPCQDVSHAGLRAGLVVGTRSGLWFEFIRAIRVLRPRIVVVENVPGLLTAGLGIVMADLAEAVYDVRGCCFRAGDLGAPHGRERLFLVATDARSERPHGRGKRDSSSTAGDGIDGRTSSAGLAAAASDTDIAGGEARVDAGRDGTRARIQPVGSSAFASDSGSEPGQPRNGRRAEGGDHARPGTPEQDGDGFVGPAEPWALAPHADDTGSQGAQSAERRFVSDRSVEWGNYEGAVRRWEQLTRPAPRPTDDRGRLDPAFVEWMLGFPEGWTDAVSSRTQRLKMLGNAVQVQAAELVGLAVQEVLAA